MTPKGRRGGVLGGVLLLVLGAACAQESTAHQLTAGPDRSTAPEEVSAAVEDLLADTVEQTTAQSLRYEVLLSTGEGMDTGTAVGIELPLGEGSQEGDRYSTRMDLGALRPRGADPGEDLSFYVVGDTETLYLKTPAGALRDDRDEPIPPGAQAFYDVLVGLGDGWGRLNLTALEDVGPETIGGMLTPGQSFDPVAVLVAAMGNDDVDELGTSELDGDPVTGLSTDISLAGLLTTQGVDLDSYLEMVARLSGLPAEGVEDLYAADRPLEVWIDDGRFIRRLEISFDLRDLPDDETAPFGLVYEFSDYGEPMSIEFPPDSEAVDITEDFAAAIGQ